MKYKPIHHQHGAYLLKWKNVFLLFLWSLIICSCDSTVIAGETEETEEPEFPVDTAYLSLGIDLNTYQRARASEGEAYGTKEENFVEKVRLVLYDGENATSKVVRSFDFDIRTNTSGTSVAWADHSGEGKDLASTTSQNDKTKFITYARKVPVADLKMLVIINVTPQLKALTEEGCTYTQLMQGVEIEKNPAKTDHIGGLAQPDHFLMTSGPGLIAIEKSKLKASVREAHNDPATATVARVVGKVTLASSDGSETFPTKDNAAVANIQWELDITNRHTYWIPQGVSGPNREQWYWIDPNYSGFGSLSFSRRQQQFFYFAALTDPYPQFKNRIRQSEYCLENTMDETDQHSDNVITRVLIRCIYKPVNVNTMGESFYVYDGKTYSSEEMKEYALEAEKLPSSLLTGIYKTIKEAYIQEGYSFITGIPAINSQEVKKSFTVKGITYYYQGVNYYGIKIRHRGVNDLNPGYAHYGVLRNTHYTVSVNRIDGPGSPGILWEDLTTTRDAKSDDSRHNSLYQNIETSITIQ